MIGEIGALVKSSFRTALLSSLLYLGGMTFGAGVFGALLGATGHLFYWVSYRDVKAHGQTVLLLVALAALLGGLRELGVIRFRLPQPAKQVPRWWFRVLGPYKTSLLWGLGVGLFFSTMVQHAVYYILAIWVLLSGDPVLGACALGCYGFVQGMLLVIEVIGIKHGATHIDGLLGTDRADFFFKMGGYFLISLGLYLVSVIVLNHYTAMGGFV
jgi:hypothetical protein